MKTENRNKLIEALNRMDEFACISVQDNDNGEAQQLAKDYKKLFDFICSIPICERKGCNNVREYDLDYCNKHN